MIDVLITVLWYIMLCWMVGLAILIVLFIWAMWSDKKARREERCQCTYPWPIRGTCYTCGLKIVQRRVDK